MREFQCESESVGERVCSCVCDEGERYRRDRMEFNAMELAFMAIGASQIFSLL